MKNILEHLYQHKTLSNQQAKGILIDIAQGKYNDCQIASFLTAFIMRNITLEELKGFRAALLELCKPVNLSAFNPIDLCGTGGDGKNTFNISTLSSFVVAGSGVPVAKHGNYGVSSVSGSSNVLQAVGINFKSEETILQEQISEANICFLHAPLFHSAMKNVAPVRKALGVKTFFNMLGPLVNPAKPKKQLVGVFNLELARMYQYLFQEIELDYHIVYALDGFDEISLTQQAKIIGNKGEDIISADYFGFSPVTYKQLFGGDTVAEAASIFMNIISGKGTETQNNVVLANASLAIKTYHQNISIEEALAMAKDSLLGLKAFNSFQTLKKLSA